MTQSGRLSIVGRSQPGLSRRNVRATLGGVADLLGATNKPLETICQLRFGYCNQIWVSTHPHRTLDWHRCRRTLMQAVCVSLSTTCGRTRNFRIGAPTRKTSGPKGLKSSISEKFQFISRRDIAYSLKSPTIIPSGFTRSPSYRNVNGY